MKMRQTSGAVSISSVLWLAASVRNQIADSAGRTMAFIGRAWGPRAVTVTSRQVIISCMMAQHVAWSPVNSLIRIAPSEG